MIFLNILNKYDSMCGNRENGSRLKEIWLNDKCLKVKGKLAQAVD